MPLELRKNKKGQFRGGWYGRYQTGGQRKCVSLGVKVKGTPPESLRELGDPAFERSRTKAQAALDALVEEAHSRKSALHLVEKAYELKTGETMRATTISSLGEEWSRIPRRRRIKEDYIKAGKTVFKRFAEYVQAHHPDVTDITGVTRAVAKGFLESEAERNVSPRTWNESRGLVGSAMRNLLPEGFTNPFDCIPTREVDTINRFPFSPEELRAIMEAAHDEDFIRPIIVTGMCTAMRRGDCCQLKWEDIDLGTGFISVKTSKTSKRVSIPIYPLLRLELEKHTRADGYVFPEQAAMYQNNPDGITYRVKKVLKKAGFVDEKTAKQIAAQGGEDTPALPRYPESELRQKAYRAIEDAEMTSPKKESMRNIFDQYMEGLSMKETAEAVGVGKGTVSAHLNQLEKLVGGAIVRHISSDPLPDVILGTTDKERPDGHNRASIRDFHSFRVTWVTLALTAGVPLELVKKVTGHRTTDIVLEHYFQPGKEDFRRTLEAAMPNLLTSGTAGYVTTPEDKVKEILAQSSSETAWEDLQAIKELLNTGDNE